MAKEANETQEVATQKVSAECLRTHALKVIRDDDDNTIIVIRAIAVARVIVIVAIWR